ncbi:MAG: MATE family efflux transporter [Deltaproteobacteria bacterium]|nr:MATE family efflux transporter [Deltaproteobacteria bacterium]
MSKPDFLTSDGTAGKPEPMDLFRDPMGGPELRALYGSIWKLSWPVFLSEGIHSVVSMINRVIVSQLGEKAFNSVNVGLMVFLLIITVIAAVAVGTTALVAQSWGAGDRRKAGQVLQQSLLFGLLLTLVITLLGMPLSRITYYLLGADQETVTLGSQYLFWLFAALPLLAPGFFMAAALRGAGDTKTPMIVGIFMGLVSLLLSYGLILGRLGMPRLETLGAALAIDGSFTFYTLVMAILFLFNRNVLKLPVSGWRLDLRLGASIFKIGIPSALEWILIQFGILIYVFIIYRYGNAAAAGYFTGIAILAFAQTPAFGIQTATTILVGQAIGARDFGRAESAFRHTTFLGFILMAAIGGLIYFAFTPTTLSWLFGKLTAESIAFSRLYVVLLVFVLPLMGIALPMAGGLRGAGDTVPPLIASTVGVYGGRILLAMGAYHLFHPSVLVIWCSMFPDLILRIAIMALRLASGRWKRAKI